MIWLRKDEIEVLQSFGKPKTLHFVLMFRFQMTHIVNRRMTKFSSGRLVDILEHAPRGVLKSLISSNPVHDE